MTLRSLHSWHRSATGAAVAACAVVLVCLVLVPSAARAQDDMPAAGTLEVQTTSVDIPEAPDLVVEDGTLRLQLEDAVAIALSRNLDLAVERYVREQGERGVMQSKGIYDLFTSLDSEVTQDESPSVSQVEGVPVLEEDTRRLTLGLSQLTPFGGVLNGSFTAFRRSTNSRDIAIDPVYSGSAAFEFTQPLLRDFGRAVTDRGILVARINSDISRDLFEQRVSEILLQVEEAYWRLVEAREQLVVARESLDLAQELHDRNRIQVDVGTLAPIELVQSEATIALRQEEIITAGARMRDSADELMRLLNLPDAMTNGLEVEPITDPGAEQVEIDVEEAIRVALEERPEVRSQRKVVERLEVDSKYYENQELPQVDVTLGYNSAGLGGRGSLVGPGGQVLDLDTGLADAFEDVYNREFTGWSIGMLIAYPLQNRSARAQSAIADLDLDRGRAELSQVELGVITEVRTTARGVRTAIQQIESARATRRLQERNLEAEQKRYENGMSDSFRIAEIQNDLTEARSREVTAVTNYRTALVRYQRAIGRLLEEKGVELVGPGDEEPQRGGLFSLFR